MIETPQSEAAARAHADASWAASKAAFANLDAGKAAKKAAAATDTMLASRADYFENCAGRYISIEARPRLYHYDTFRVGDLGDGKPMPCQEHAREWATSLMCLETAERLLRTQHIGSRTRCGRARMRRR